MAIIERKAAEQGGRFRRVGMLCLALLFLTQETFWGIDPRGNNINPNQLGCYTGDFAITTTEDPRVYTITDPYGNPEQILIIENDGKVSIFYGSFFKPQGQETIRGFNTTNEPVCIEPQNN